MFGDENQAEAVGFGSSAQRADYDLTEPDELRARAARYRALAETLTDFRVVRVVQACARELELRAMAARETSPA